MIQCLIEFEETIKMLGIVGSGNVLSNNQYCLTAKQYSQRFWLSSDTFELRGLQNDISRVGDKTAVNSISFKLAHIRKSKHDSY